MTKEKETNVEKELENVLENVGDVAKEVEKKVVGTVGKGLEGVKKLDDLKETAENKEAIVKAEGKNVGNEKAEKKSLSAVEKVASKKGKKKVEEKVEIEREYVVPLRRGFLNVPHYRRAKKAVRVLKEFMVRHMQIRDRDLRKVKVDINLNNEIWFRGIKKPLHKIKVRAVKKDGVVTVTLANPSDYVKFKMARDEKKLVASVPKEKGKIMKKEKVDADKDKDGVDDNVEKREDAKSEALKDQKVARAEVKDMKHSTKGAHEKKVVPRKNNPKK